MNIEITNKEIQELGRLAKCLDSLQIPVDDLRIFLTGLQRRVAQASAVTPRKRVNRKEDRKNKYRISLKVAS